MAVKKLVGKIDGTPIVFERVEGDLWETTIPPSLNGAYIVELMAIDEAGNEGYCARYIITIDLTALCVSIRPYAFEAELCIKGYDAEIHEETFETEEAGVKRFETEVYTDIFGATSVRTGE